MAEKPGEYDETTYRDRLERQRLARLNAEPVTERLGLPPTAPAKPPQHGAVGEAADGGDLWSQPPSAAPAPSDTADLSAPGAPGAPLAGDPAEAREDTAPEADPAVRGALPEEPVAAEGHPVDEPPESDGATLSLFGSDLFGDEVRPEVGGAMHARFVMPPFSVLDARSGAWQDRKRAWLSYGIRSELGRGAELLFTSEETQDRDYYRRKEGTRPPADERATLKGALTYRVGKHPYDGKGRKPDARSYGTDLMRGEGGYSYGGKTKRTGNAQPGQGSTTNSALARDPRYATQAKAIPGGGSGKNSAWMHRTAEGYAAGDEAQIQGAGTSIFDPVLCELAYRWFCPPGGRVLDPFAGGVVRGWTAACLGYPYVGIDLSERQLAANRQQWDTLPHPPRPLGGAVRPPEYLPELTPVERRADLWVKREDLFSVAGVRGGKVRTCWALARGATGLVTAGSRSSPQVNIVAHIARRLGLPCRVHTPQGALSPEVRAAQEAGAEVVQHRAGYNSVIIARAREDAAERGWREIPFGMECAEAVRQTAGQVANLPPGRLVVPVGSGMTLAGILQGLSERGDTRPVLGVVCGADPAARLDAYAPRDWRSRGVTLVPAGVDYHVEAAVDLAGLVLDPVYEAKVVPFLEPDDVLWNVGIRQTLADAAVPPPLWIDGDSAALATYPGVEGQEFDFLFTCPPYADLECYSTDPRDLSTMTYNEFRAAYARIIAEAVGRLKADRFACVVVGEVRDKSGPYYGFVPDTVRAFEAAGAAYYNELVLLTAVGSLPVRTGKQFQVGRKIGKSHQNVLVFCKGDWRRAAAACGEIALGRI